MAMVQKSSDGAVIDSRCRSWMMVVVVVGFVERSEVTRGAEVVNRC